MTALEVLPDALAIVRSVLLDNIDFVALDVHVASRQSRDLTKPFVHLVRAGGSAVAPERLDGAVIDVNVYGKDETTVSTITRLARGILLNSRNIITSFGLYSGGGEVVGIQDLPDDRDPPLERQGFSIVAYVHRL